MNDNLIEQHEKQNVEGLMMTDQAKIKQLEEICERQHKKIIELLRYKNRLFRQAFCAALPCFIDGNLDIDRPINAVINVEQAIKHAQEAVRQVGELSEPSKYHVCEDCLIARKIRKKYESEPPESELDRINKEQARDS